jgi:hypothetical protein
MTSVPERLPVAPGYGSLWLYSVVTCGLHSLLAYVDKNVSNTAL